MGTIHGFESSNASNGNADQDFRSDLSHGHAYRQHAGNIQVLPTTAEDNKVYSYTLHCVYETLEKGGVVAVPTDTVYGLIALPKYAHRLHEIKRRDANKPFGLFVDNTKSIEKYGQVTVPPALLRELCPGPVTLVFERKPHSLPHTFNLGVTSVGFRIPMNRLIHDISSHYIANPVVQTSANVSGAALSPIRIEDFEELHDQLALIVDTGVITQGDGNREGSTVVDLSVPGHYRILRDGCVRNQTLKTLRKFRLAPVPATIDFAQPSIVQEQLEAAKTDEVNTTQVAADKDEQKRISN